MSKTNACDFCGLSRSEVGYLVAGPKVFICDSCVVLSAEIVQERQSAKSESDVAGAKNPLAGSVTPSSIKQYLDRHVIGQSDAKRVLAVAVYQHYKRINAPSLGLEKSNVMLIGPSGSGKTLLAKSIAKILDVPFAMSDATALTEAGYVGMDVESVVTKLYQASGQDVAKTERGVIFIDEIDKIARKGQNGSITRDVSGEGVQQSLLKMLEGHSVQISPNEKRHHPGSETVTINTDNILFIVGGAFVGCGALEGKTTTEHLIRFGMIPEFIGRIPVIVNLAELSRDDLKQVLTGPENSIVKQYSSLFLSEAIDLEFTDCAYNAIVEQALKRGTGARGLRSILEDSLLNTIYELPNAKNKRCVVDAEVIRTKAIARFIDKPAVVAPKAPLSVVADASVEVDLASSAVKVIKRGRGRAKAKTQAQVA